MPWARNALGRLKGGADRITCDTCHGVQADARAWRMPAVAALPQPDLRLRGWETYNSGMDAQMRNAIYGYLAESDNQAKATYMREVVLPGMAQILRRPAYDFAQSYRVQSRPPGGRLLSLSPGEMRRRWLVVAFACVLAASAPSAQPRRRLIRS